MSSQTTFYKFGLPFLDSFFALTIQSTSAYKERVDRIDFPDPNMTTTITYDDSNRVESVTRAGLTTSYTYDDRGNTLTVTDHRSRTVTYTYTDDDLVETVTDPTGQTVTYAYDTDGNLSSVTGPLTAVSFGYDDYGRIVSTTDPNSNITSYDYDTFGYLRGIFPPVGQPTIFTNDALGRVTAVEANDLVVTVDDYTDLNQILSVTYPDNTAMTYTYDFKKLDTVTDRTGQTTTFDYQCGTTCQVISTTGPLGTITYARDNKGRVEAVTVNGQTTAYSRDVMGRVLSVTNPDASVRSFTYNALGQVATRTNENGLTTAYTYDLERLTGIDYPDDTADVGFSYDPLGRLTGMTDGLGTTAYGYDDYSRLDEVDGPFADDLITYAYNNLGQRTGLTLPNFNAAYNYDDFGRLTDVTSTYASAHYDYDPTYSRLSKVTYGNGAYTDYGYDSYHRLDLLQNKQADGTIISGFGYGYNDHSLIDQITDHEGNVSSYLYDSAFRLTDEWVKTATDSTLWHNGFTYDNMGNRLSLTADGVTKTYDYNNVNELLSIDDGSTFEYDNAGNLIHWVTPTDTMDFSYDAENRLVRVDFSDGDYEEYIYNGNSERRQILKNGIVDISFEYDRLFVPIIIQRGAKNKFYTWGASLGAGIRGLIAESTELDSSIYYFYNHRGDVVNKYGNPEILLDTQYYSAFGKKIPIDTSNIKSEFSFSTKWFDESTRFHYFGFRFYSTELSRWLTNDPLKFRGGFNFYEFSRNSPMNYGDPLGLEVTCWARPADLPFPANQLEHWWIRTDTYEAGMGEREGEIPGQDGNVACCYIATQTVDHTGQSNMPNAHQLPIPFQVDEECVNELIRPGNQTGPWVPPFNDCHTFVWSVLNRCRCFNPPVVSNILSPEDVWLPRTCLQQ